MDFELRHLEHAVAVADHRSFARAAAALHLSQPALTRSIQVLEERMRTQLFVRARKGVEPTDSGLLLLEHAREVLQRAVELQRRMQRTHGLVVGRLAVGAGPYPADLILGAAALRMRAAHAGVALDLVIGRPTELVQRVRAGELAFAVVETTLAAAFRELEVRQLARHPGYMVVRRGHPLAARRRVSVADVLTWPLVVPGQLPPRLFERLTDPLVAEPQGPARPRPDAGIECSSVPLMKQLVAGSDAVGFFALANIEREVEADLLVPLRCVAPWLHSQYGVVRVASRPRASGEPEFTDLLAEEDARIAASEDERCARLTAHRDRQP